MMIYKVLDTNNEINNWYRSSNLPKLVRKMIAKSKRNKLRKFVNQYVNDENHLFTLEEIYEFIEYCNRSLDHPEMYLESILWIDEDPWNVYSTTFKCDVDEENKTYIFSISNISMRSNEFILSIRERNVKGIRTIAAINCNETGLRSGVRDKPEDIQNLVRGFNAMIAEMMGVLLNKALDRSERIYEI
jgi:hypothetical protein